MDVEKLKKLAELEKATRQQREDEALTAAEFQQEEKRKADQLRECANDEFKNLQRTLNESINWLITNEQVPFLQPKAGDTRIAVEYEPDEETDKFGYFAGLKESEKKPGYMLEIYSSRGQYSNQKMHFSMTSGKEQWRLENTAEPSTKMGWTNEELSEEFIRCTIQRSRLFLKR